MPLLLPKRVKFRKSHHTSRRGTAKGGTKLSFGEFGIKALESGWISSAQIEASRVTITRAAGKGSKIWIRIFPDRPLTVHGQEKPMGSGKGTVDHWVAVAKRGRILFELEGVPELTARTAFRLVSYKLPIRTRFVTRKTQAATV